MTRGFDDEAFATFAVYLFPSLGALVSIGGAALIARKTLRKTRKILMDARHWRDETYSMWCDIYEDQTVQFRRPHLGDPLTVDEQKVGLDSRPGQRAARHRLTEPPRQRQAFRGELPNVSRS